MRLPAPAAAALATLALTTAALATTTAATAALASAAVDSAPVHVTPASGSPATAFTISFRQPAASPLPAATQRHIVVAGSLATASRRGCVASFSLIAPAAKPGAIVRVVVSPARVGGDLCRGRFTGAVTEQQSPVCRTGQICPLAIVLLRVIGRFSFEVAGAA